MQILYLEVKKSIFLLHMVCDIIGIAQHLFEIQDGGQVLFTVSKLIRFF